MHSPVSESTAPVAEITSLPTFAPISSNSSINSLGSDSTAAAALSTGGIIGLIVGIIAICCCFGLFFYYRRNFASERHSSGSDENSVSTEENPLGRPNSGRSSFSSTSERSGKNPMAAGIPPPPSDSPKKDGTPKTPTYKSRFSKKKAMERSRSGSSNVSGPGKGEGQEMEMADYKSSNSGNNSVDKSMSGSGDAGDASNPMQKVARGGGIVPEAAATKRAGNNSKDSGFEEGDDEDETYDDDGGKAGAPANKAERMDQSDLSRVSFSIFSGAQLASKDNRQQHDDDFDFRRGKLIFLCLLLFANVKYYLFNFSCQKVEGRRHRTSTCSFFCLS